MIESEAINVTCTDITCDPNQSVVLADLSVRALINSIPACDETIALIPDGSIFRARIRKVIRLDPVPGPAGAPLGYILNGRFWIINPAGTTIMFGQMFGTEGFETHPGCAGPECDSFPHMEGHLRGRGIGPLNGYRLEVSYQGEQEADPENCEWPWMKFQTDGILYRICSLKTSLGQNFRNLFNPETWIPYTLADDVDVVISIYNLSGRLVRTLELGYQPAGSYMTKAEAAYWDGKDGSGEKVASGVYFYTLQAGDFRATRKMVIRK
jgi:hypothetical protein